MEKKIYKLKLLGKELVVEYGYLARQADGSILVRYGDTVVLVTVVMNDAEKEIDFFPLTVVFQEKLYSVGKIPGGFLKREGKPSEFGILSARLIDRAIRPLFPKGFRKDVQIVINVLAVDNDHDVRIASLFGTSLALGISSIPLAKLVAGVLVTLDKDYNVIINPDLEQLNNGLMELVVAGTNEAINMVEAEAKEISEEYMLNSIIEAHKVIKELISFQEQIVSEVGRAKKEVVLFNVRDEIKQHIFNAYNDKISSALEISDKAKRNEALAFLKDEIYNMYENSEYNNDKEKQRVMLEVSSYINELIRSKVRNNILYHQKRIDNRRFDEIRPLYSEIDILPVVHGSALFTRGETQVLSVLTLGALGENQIIDGITDEDAKRFMHHYNFPPFSVGETGRIGAPNRREIGHGALGERALMQVIPSEREFPYTIRLVSEVLESNGSTSQASICASVLALMAGGVPIKCPIAGIAMGLIKENDKYAILTDIQGIEDHLGDMDFKVAGSKDGICALQMDIKIEGITKEILNEALLAAKKARLEILEHIVKTIDKPRDTLAPTAPKMKTFIIPIDKIREVIGTGGKIITSIIERSNDVKIDIQDDGQVTIYHRNYEDIDKAYRLIKDIVSPIEVNEEYTGTVVKIEKFGAFVNLKENVDGLIHISKLADHRVEKTEDIVNLNDNVLVKVIEIDDKGKIKLRLVKVLTNKGD